MKFKATDNSKINPRRLKLNIGDKAVLTCKSKRNVQWFFFPTTSLPYNFIHGSRGDTATVKLTTFKRWNAGYYYCYGYDQIKMRHFVARAEILVKGKRMIIDYI